MRHAIGVCLIVVPILAAGAESSPIHLRRGFYSAKATNIWEHVLGTPKAFVIPSPNGKSEIHAIRSDENGVTIVVSGKTGALTRRIGDGVSSEVLWAPDSKGFFITTSNGGLNGDYHLFVFDDFDGKFGVRDLTPLIYKRFGHPVICGYPEVPNVGGVTWLGSSGHVLVAAEIIAHSNCDSFGTFRAYEVDPASMKIVRTYGQIEAKQEFGSELGDELLNAPDECIRDPKACYVSTNHPELSNGTKTSK